MSFLWISEGQARALMAQSNIPDLLPAAGTRGL